MKELNKPYEKVPNEPFYLFKIFEEYSVYIVAENKEEAAICYVENYGDEKDDEEYREFKKENPNVSYADYVEGFTRIIHPQDFFYVENEKGEMEDIRSGEFVKQKMKEEGTFPRVVAWEE